jgi:hypothetical protein
MIIFDYLVANNKLQSERETTARWVQVSTDVGHTKHGYLTRY